MLTKLFEWYRVVNSNPSDDTVEKRGASAKDLVGQLKKATDYKLLISCVSGAVVGFDPSSDQKSEVVKLIVGCVRKHQPAFPEDLSENALELRILSAVAIGELLVGSLQRNGKEDSLVAAALINSALPARPVVKGKHLQSVLTELARLANDVLDRSAVARREREELTFEGLDSVEGADLPTFWSNLLPQLKTCMQSLQAEATRDREELDVLWWMYTGFCRKNGKPFAGLKLGELIFCCGGELADLVLVPPGRSPREMVRRVIRDNSTEKAEIQLKKIASDWTPEILSLLVSTGSSTKQLIQAYPALLPLSWLSNRLAESQGAAGWSEEFTRKTGIRDTCALAIEDWAIQVFNERIAQRLYLEAQEEIE